MVESPFSSSSVDGGQDILHFGAGRSSPFAQQLLDTLDDPIARNQHAPDDDQSEDHELRAVGSPIVRITWLRPVRNRAAANVDNGLARPPVREAPPITTAAIGPRRYCVPTAIPGVRRSPDSATPAMAKKIAAIT